MQSESARVTTAEQSRFRINDPTARPRAVKVIALDRKAEPVVKRLSELKWNGATFFTACAFAAQPQAGKDFSVTGWLADLAGRSRDLVNEVNAADLVVMVATPGENAAPASILRSHLNLQRLMTTAIIVRGSV